MGVVRTLCSVWFVATNIVSGIDTYQGQACNPRSGNYANAGPRADPVDKSVDFFKALPFGMMRGVLLNGRIAFGDIRSCAGSTTTGQLRREIGSDTGRQAFAFNQAVIGIPGAAFSGALVEAMAVSERNTAAARPRF